MDEKTMVIIRTTALILLLSLTACQAKEHQNITSSPEVGMKWTMPYGDWNFEFFNPNALPTLVTYVRIVDSAGNILTYNNLDITEYDPESQGHWSNLFRSSQLAYFNKVRLTSQYMIFCWDSIIDMKTYETSLFFPQEVWQKMKTPASYKARSGNTVWYKTMLFGLAPEGKVRVWLQDVGNHPNYPLPVTDLKTVSGNEMTICKGITRHTKGYGYTKTTQEFIKGKTYPYGSW